MTTNNTTSIHNQHTGKHISYRDKTSQALPCDKILEILLYLSVRDPISFNQIHCRHLKTPADWIRFVDYSKTCPKRDGIGYTSRQAIIRFLSTRDTSNISRHEAIILTKIARPRSDQIPNLRPLFDKIRIWDE